MKLLHSFTELGTEMGISTRKPRQAETKECFRCGGKMTRVPGTNVFLCQGTTDNPCKNVALSSS